MLFDLPEDNMRRISICFLLALLCTALGCTAQSAAPAQSGAAAQSNAAQIALPAASRSGGITLNEALARRRSVRSFTAEKLTPEQIAQLAWSAQGISGEQGHRTAPSAHAKYYLHLYLAQPEGFFEYIPASHSLQQLGNKDLRATLSEQGTVKNAPYVFLIAGEYDRAIKDTDRERGTRFVNLEAGHAAQNLLLQATALGLGAVPVGGIEPQQTAKAASLPANIVPIYLIPVGRPK
jgi:SagB-type dehydrogenase family enzyme